MTPEQITELSKSLGDIKSLGEKSNTSLTDQGRKIIDLETARKADSDELAKVRADLDKMRKAQLASKATRTPGRPGQVSDECAKHIAERVCLQAEAIGALEKGGMDAHRRDALTGVSREILGMAT